MSPAMTITDDLLECFPRVSGDEPAGFPFTLNDGTFSPRERG